MESDSPPLAKSLRQRSSTASLQSPPFPSFGSQFQQNILAINSSRKLDILDEMNSAVRQNSSVTYNNSRGCGNVIDSNNTETNNYSIYVSDERQQVLEWLSPLTSRERHWDVRDARVDGVGDWLLRTEIFSAWHLSEDEVSKPVLLCYGDPGVGKTYFRYEPPRPPHEWNAKKVAQLSCDRYTL